MYERAAYYEHERVQIETGQESLVQQSMGQETDINWIMRRYQEDRLIEHVNRYKGRYEDVSTAPDLQQAFEKVEAAEAAFMSLPSDLRKEFDNDPAKFLEWVQDPANAEEVREKGLGRAEEAPIPVIIEGAGESASEASEEAAQPPGEQSST